MGENSYKKPVKKTDMASLYELIAPVIEDGDTVKINVSGYSMYPLVVSRRDRVLLGKVEQLKIGDVPLFRREDGSFILHRIVKIKDGAYAMMGDYETKEEYPIYPSQIVAVAKGFYRKEKFISCESAIYRLYSFVWRHTLCIRVPILKLLAKMVSFKTKNKRKKC